MTTMAVIIPTWNEERNLAECLAAVFSQSRPADAVVVADGGSTDGTARIAELLGVRLKECPDRGRGLQVRHALQTIEADVAVVVHADMRLAPGSLEAIDRQMKRFPECPGGCLDHRFDRDGLLLRLIECFDWIRASVMGISYGDQVQFFRLNALDRVGGFPNQPIMEDLELSLRLRTLGRMANLRHPAVVSARRFDRLGVLPTIWSNLQFRRAYRRGGLAACERIYQQYHGQSSDAASPTAVSETTP